LRNINFKLSEDSLRLIFVNLHGIPTVI